MTTAQGGGKVVSPMHRSHLPPGNPPGTHFCQRLSRLQGHSATGRIMSMKISSDTTSLCNIKTRIYRLSLFLSLSLSFFLSQTDFHLPILCGCRGYCCPLSHSMTHTHTHTLQDFSDRVIGQSQISLLDNTQQLQKTDIYALSRIRTHNSSKRAVHTQVLDCAITGIDPLSA